MLCLLPSDSAHVMLAPLLPHAAAGGMMWDEQLMSGILELNRLRRSLAITSLTWAAALQEPSFFAQMLAASSSAAVTAAVAAAAAAAVPPGSPMAVAVAAAAAAAAAAAGLAAGGESNSGSTHGGSMFHLPPAVAAQRMGISDGQGEYYDSRRMILYIIVLSSSWFLDCALHLLPVLLRPCCPHA
jgi:hypothetical protein